jgi:hypothetical protein
MDGMLELHDRDSNKSIFVSREFIKGGAVIPDSDAELLSNTKFSGSVICDRFGRWFVRVREETNEISEMLNVR